MFEKKDIELYIFKYNNFESNMHKLFFPNIQPYIFVRKKTAQIREWYICAFY